VTVILLASLILLPVATAQAGSDLAQWRKAYADEIDQPDGWLSLVALEWLQDGDTTIGSATGNKVQLKHVPPRLGVVRKQGASFQLVDPAVGVTLDGHSGGGALSTDHSEHPSVIASGEISMTIIQRGDRYYLRIKDAASPTRLHFHGLNWYPPDPRLVITARWVPYAQPKILHVLNVLGQTSDEPSPGYAEFTIGGQTVRLEPVAEPNALFFDFRDTTAQTTTYGAGRFLTTLLPDHGVGSAGTVVLDFNRAHNPPCGYTPYATCPLPTPGNRLNVAIPAGEKRYESSPGSTER
jgi:uncharacterized protein (DUF1684 family)